VINLATSPLMQWVNRTGNFTYAAPPPAAGGASGIPIATGDTRTFQVAGVGNATWLAQGTSCQFTNGTAIEACARYIRFDVGQSAGNMTATLQQQTVMGGGNGWYYFYPSIAVNGRGDAATAFDVSSTGSNFSGAWATKLNASANFPGSTFLSQGTCALAATFDSDWDQYRAGDYTGAAVDPSNNLNFWVEAERAANITGVGCGWATRISQLSP
jgi:hypothetical protein